MDRREASPFFWEKSLVPFTPTEWCNVEKDALTGIKPPAFLFSTGKGQSVGTKAVFDPEANFSVEGNPLDWFPGTFFQHENLAFVPSVRHRRIESAISPLAAWKTGLGIGRHPIP